MPSFRGKFPAKVSVAERKARAEAAAVRLAKGKGGGLQPVRPEGKTLTQTFWGTAWCENLQSYADLAYRLDRGRSYLRSGAVIDLRLESRQIRAKVVGTRVYGAQLSLAELEEERWRALVRTCTGRISGLVALLRGDLPDEVMEAVTDREAGLFPRPHELTMSCSCPDSARLCKHLAAVLYGVGVRLDSDPAILFTLRGRAPQDLLEHATTDLATATTTTAPTLSATTSELAELFGIELVEAPKGKKKRKS